MAFEWTPECWTLNLEGFKLLGLSTRSMPQPVSHALLEGSMLKPLTWPPSAFIAIIAVGMFEPRKPALGPRAAPMRGFVVGRLAGC